MPVIKANLGVRQTTFRAQPVCESTRELQGMAGYCGRLPIGSTLVLGHFLFTDAFDQAAGQRACCLLTDQKPRRHLLCPGLAE